VLPAPGTRAPAPAAGARFRQASSYGGRRSLVGIALTLPALLALAVTMVYPVAWTVWLSLNGPQTAMRGTVDFKGLGNYTRIAGSAEFRAALWQTLQLVFASFVLEAILGLVVALALHRGLRGSRIFSAIVAMPLMVAPIVGALAWRFIFVDGYGMIDSIASAFGTSGPLWFADIWLARASIVIANLWMALPFDILVLLAGLASLPSDPLEAARVDGATPSQLLVFIILPLLKPVIAVILVVRLADAFRIFDVVYVLTGGGPANTTDVLSTYIYRQMFTVLDFPGGAAAAILLVLITAAFSLLAVLLLRDRRMER
jgi:multiple sugar transport system permease protein